MQKGLNQFLRRALGGTFLMYGSGVVAAFAVQVLLTRLLGPSMYGDYYFVFAWVMALLVFAKFGVDNAVLRFAPAYLAKHEWGLLKGLIRWGTGRVIWLSLATSALLATLIGMFGEMPQHLEHTFYVASVALPLLAYVYLRSSLLKSLKHVVLALLPEAILAPAVLALVMIFTWVVIPEGLTSTHAMLATVVGLAFSGFVGHFLLSRRLPAELNEASAADDRSLWSISTRSMVLITGAHLMLNNTDAIMLGLLRESESVGVYAVAAKCSILVFFPLTIANATIAPLIPQYHALNDHSQLQQALDQSMKLVTGVSVAVFCLVLVMGEQLLSIFGPDFKAGYTALVILGIGGLVNALAGPVANLLALTGSESFVSRVMVATTALNIGLNLLLIPSWGLEGAALATAISMATWNLVMFVASRRRLGLNPNGFLIRHSVT